MLATIGSLALAAPPPHLGGLDLNAACQHQKQDPSARARLGASTDPYSWSCGSGERSLGGLDLNAACRRQKQRPDARAVVLDANSASSWVCVAPSPAQAPHQSYTSWGNETETLYPAVGSRVVLLLDAPRPEHETAPVLALLDRCAAHYATFSGGRWPTRPLPSHPEHASLSIVATTCGAGCGAGGRAELTRREHHDAVRRLSSFTHPLTWNVGLYELGRGGSSPKHPAFPFYSALDPSPNHEVVASSFPEFMAAMCTELSGVPIHTQVSTHSAHGYPRVPGPHAYVELFMAGDFSFAAAVEHKQGALERNWALAALLYDLERTHGIAFMQRLFVALTDAPRATSGQDVANNLAAAIEVAGGKTAREEAVKRWRLDG